MEVGNIIRSYDFPHNTTCYMEGEIVEISNGFLICRTTNIVWSGEQETIPEGQETFRTPEMGNCMMDDRFERVVVIA